MQADDPSTPERIDTLYCQSEHEVSRTSCLIPTRTIGPISVESSKVHSSAVTTATQSHLTFVAFGHVNPIIHSGASDAPAVSKQALERWTALACTPSLEPTRPTFTRYESAMFVNPSRSE